MNADPKGLMKSPATITKISTGSTWLTADLSTASRWETILTFAVPLGLAYEVNPSNYFFANLDDTAGTAVTGGYVRLVKANANQSNTIELWAGPSLIFKDIGDALQRPNIKVPVTVNASEVLLVQVYSLGTTLDSVTSDVYIEAMQYYAPVA